MACSADISTSGTSNILKDQYGFGYSRKPLSTNGWRYRYFYVDEEGAPVKSAEDLRKELKKAEKAERKAKRKQRELDDRYAIAIKNLKRLAAGDGASAVMAAKALIEESR